MCILGVGGGSFPVRKLETHHNRFDVMALFTSDKEFDSLLRLFWRELHVVHLLSKVR